MVNEMEAIWFRWCRETSGASLLINYWRMLMGRSVLFALILLQSVGCSQTQMGQSADTADDLDTVLTEIPQLVDLLEAMDASEAVERPDSGPELEPCEPVQSSLPCQECRRCGGKESCTPLPVGTPCNDDECCTLDDQCQACQPDGGNCPDFRLQCVGHPMDCSAGSACRIAGCVCSNGIAGCAETAVPDGQACEFDAALCTEDKCQAGVCQQGPSKVVEDGNPCTKETCVNGTAQVEKLSAGQCDDLDPCTEGDACLDGECVGSPNPLCPATCGNQVCEAWESSESCPLDCPASCGDGFCSESAESQETCPNDCPAKCLDGFCGPGESVFTCPTDCPPACGNGVCEPLEGTGPCPVDCGWCGDGVCGLPEAGQNGGSCPRDCLAACGNGKCEGGESSETCLVDCSGCGDGFCGLKEDITNCGLDCKPGCGNKLCEWGENILVCTIDCMPTCGDEICEYPENPYNCQIDCTVCGDGLCNLSEAAAQACPQDCAIACGNGVCEGGENDKDCPIDCGYCGDNTCGWVETSVSCFADCGFSCGDGVCAGNENIVNCAGDCTLDADQDGLHGMWDNCATAANPLQEDADKDSKGDACDPDDDNDGYPDGADNCPTQWNPGQADFDWDSRGDNCDSDADDDGALNETDCEWLDPSVFPGAVDYCDGHDNDCDGTEDNAQAPCTLPQHLCILGECVCQPDCTGKECGDDGCGENCGGCQNGMSCQNGDCLVICGDSDCDSSETQCSCPSDCGNCPGCCSGDDCSSGTSDVECGIEGETCAQCLEGETCQDQVCVVRCGDSRCALGDENCQSCPSDCGICCGNAICELAFGEDCTTCPLDCGCEACGEACESGECRFVGCDGKDCGDDGCQGTCGSCGEHLECQAGQCVAVPWCGDTICNHDLLENCDTCTIDCACTACGETCEQGTCTFTACAGRQCGADGCGGSCGSCAGPQDECIGGACACKPACEGRQCGDDGCGGSCGGCASDQACLSGVCITNGFVVIPPGSFWMGSPDGTCPQGYPGTCTSEAGRSSSEMLHYVQLTHTFEMKAHEITQGEWKASFGGTNPSYFPSCGDSCPVDGVTWFSILEYANALSVSRGYPPCYALSACSSGTAAGGTLDGCTVKVTASAENPYNCLGYRLPTESEWEYAYRAGSTTAFYSSEGNNGSITQIYRTPLDSNLDKIAWYGGNSKATYPGAANCITWYPGSNTCGLHAIGGKAPNSWGLYDMSGNAWERVWDWHVASYPSGSVAAPLVDPLGGANGTDRVSRGGSWYGYALNARAADRGKATPGYRTSDLGFRLARTVD